LTRGSRFGKNQSVGNNKRKGETMGNCRQPPFLKEGRGNDEVVTNGESVKWKRDGCCGKKKVWEKQEKKEKTTLRNQLEGETKPCEGGEKLGR